MIDFIKAKHLFIIGTLTCVDKTSGTYSVIVIQQIVIEE